MNNKKTIITLILVLFIGIIGLTVAYFSNSTTIDNLFSTKEYGSTITETFTSPSNWLPGDTTEKKVVATNTGEVDQAVRISYTEKWLSTNKNELNGWIHEDGTKSNHETELELNTDERVALINFDNNDDWTYNNGYYYYNYRLQPNESTSSLIKSVSFNSKTKLDDTCTTTISEGKKTITCNSSGDNYDGATYTLTFIIENVQYDKYMSAWNTDVAILNEQSLFCDAFEVGEVVEYNNAEYYVLKDSSTSDDYVTLLKKDPLTASEVNQYSDSYVSIDGEYPYFESDTCNENNETGCSTNYNTSDVKKIVDGWSNSFSDDLVSVDGYKTRLVDENDLEFSISNDYYCGQPMVFVNFDNDTPKFIKIKKNYWTLISVNDSDNNMVGINLTPPNVYNTFEKEYIRPVINLKKSLIHNSCSNIKNDKKLLCIQGDEVIYNSEKYYVMENSGGDKKFVKLLKANYLTADEVNQYSTNYVSENGEYPYYRSDTCNSNDLSGCINDYDNSDIKKIIDGWSNNFSNDLIKYYDYNARLVNYDDIFENLGYAWIDKQCINGWYDEVPAPSSNTPIWVNIEGSNYWSTISYRDCSSDKPKSETVIGSELSKESIYNSSFVRPVIYLRKSAIESGCSLANYDSYDIGEIINYNNSNYCVIKNSTNIDDYVTLIKQEPLTYEELVNYNNGYEISRDSIDNNFGIISYYKSDTCYYNSDSDKNLIGCSNYDNSFIKNIVSKWSNSISNDLKEVDGYKARLITYKELVNLGHVFINQGTGGSINQKSDYDCLYSDADYWTMSNYSDLHGLVDIVSKVEANNHLQYIDKQYAVRPVINLKKCALTNTCD